MGIKFFLPKSPTLTNAKLNAIEPWKHRRCTRCGRRYPDTLLNIEGVLERGEQLQCYNRRSCEEFRKAVRR